MAHRSTIAQAVQIGVEPTPGTAVAAGKLLQALGFNLAPNGKFDEFRPMGTKFPTLIAEQSEFSQAALDGYPTYTEIVYPLSSVLTAAGIVTATGVTTWTFTPNSLAEDAPKTYTIERGGSVQAEKAAYGIITDFGIDISRQQVKLNGNLIAQLLQTGITMTATPTSLALVPVLPKQIDIFVDTTSGGLGTTKLLGALTANWKVASRYGPLWFLNSALTSFAGHVEIAPEITAAMKMEADATGMGFLANARAGDKRFIRILATGGQIASTGINYSLQIDMAAEIGAVGQLADDQGVYAIEYTFKAVHDQTWGKACQVIVKNDVTAL